MSRKKLEAWAKLLLDTGKRNNLINFRDTKSSSLELLLPDADVLLSRSETTADLEAYDPKYTEAEEEEIPGKTRRERFLETHAPRLKKNQILLYSENADPIEVLRNIAKKAGLQVEETGVNVAYMTFGFIHWKDGEGEYRAPILLVPVHFTNESAISPWKVCMTGDGTIVNPTFRFKLESELGIRLPAYEEEGFSAYLEVIREMTEKLGWQVSEGSRIALLSFQKLNMYQDLMENAEKVLANPNILRLLGEPVPEGEALKGHRVENPLIELHNVVNADSSQIEAIQMAKEGKSFVLQGPPGTGKSQTITNIIAECLHDGKKVLFVSEKLAALKVVYEKLRKAGLEEFCLELHSNKANKKDVIADLCRTLRLEKTEVSPRAEEEILQKKRAQKELDLYDRELHRERPVIGKSVYELYGDYGKTETYPAPEIQIPEIRTRDQAYLREVTELLRQYVQLSSQLGYDYRLHPWYGYRKQDTSWQELKSLREDLESVLALSKSLQEEKKALDEAYGISPECLDDFLAAAELMKLLSESEFLTQKLLLEATYKMTADKQMALASEAREILTLRKAIAEDYDKGIFKLSGEELSGKLQKLYTKAVTRFFDGGYRQLIRELTLCRNTGKKPDYEEAIRITKLLAEYQEREDAFVKASEPLTQVLGRGWNGPNTDFATLSRELDVLGSYYASELDFGQLALWEEELYDRERAGLGSRAKRLLRLFRESETERYRLADSFDHSCFSLSDTVFPKVTEKLSGCLSGFESLENHIRRWSVVNGLKEQGAEEFLHRGLDEKIPAELLVPSYEKLFCHRMIDAILHEEPALTEFNRDVHEHASEIFRAKDETQFAISKVQIRADLSGERPSSELIPPGSPLAKLLREGEKKRRQMPIRKLLEETGMLVQQLKPCFLMSPLSVSTYLGSLRFDVVIFDEASQIFPQDAVGAIYRGEQVIVVGDSRQMPPSNFFQSMQETEGDEESGDLTDFESILDICSVCMQQIRLKWHYRSRYEDLIAFSNRNFYDNDLVTFPSAVTSGEGIGVEYIYAGGQFEHKTRINRGEAEQVVEQILRHADRYPDRSLGVVAFSISQQELIEKLLLKARREDPSREAFFRSDRQEPFFVKNLETVQGDERDTIIFSIAYGPDANGKLLYNFGPLNRAGGERRLNVAITRAKKNVKLISSMHYTDLDLSHTGAEGARLLRDYLKYAELGAGASEAGPQKAEYEASGDDFVHQVGCFLREKGYEVDEQVGCSRFRIDLGLRKPGEKDYRMAIECDGDTYHSFANTRDRDWLRQSVLEGMGWKFCRVWSTEWFKNREAEERRLLEAAFAACEEKMPEAEEEKQPEEVLKEDDFIQTSEEMPFQFPVYEMQDDALVFARIGSFKKGVKQLLFTEAPLSEEWLLKRTARIWFGQPKVTPAVKKEYRTEMQDCESEGILRLEGFLWPAGMEEVMLRVPADPEEKRELRYICREELAAGFREILKQSICVERSDLFKYTAKLLGFRMGEAIEEQMLEALELLEEEIHAEGTLLSLKKESPSEVPEGKIIEYTGESMNHESE